MPKVLKALVVALLVAGAVAGAVAMAAYKRYTEAGPLAQPVNVVIPKGSGVAAIADKLAQAGVIDYPLIFKLAARELGKPPLKAGEYAFSPGLSVRGVLDLMREGQTVIRRVTIPEGLTNREVAQLLLATEGLEGEVASLPAEGWLMPETYHFSYGDARQDLIDRMARSMRQTLAELWEARAEGLPLKSPEEALVLASIVEKETGLAHERKRVAAVFVNRLKKGMKLQSDPTVIYGRTNGQEDFDRSIRKSDLKHENDYNTYVIDGLPPGPIANPGRAAIEAALNPASTQDLFFVADGTGGHVFARTLDDHNRNVARWRKLQGR